ncbi:LuxR C-terminal-related transcriptional regulator [Lysinibacillus sp. NPDC096418]|uniref:LuxR C-terminal-related transcriptional regulator n=1 Tax=Lysinibacillus sp. NPDC096418 TaxID=3364138 RepID=UPI0038240E0A
MTLQGNEIYDLLAKGITNSEIAEQLDLSEGTVRVYLSTIYSKLGGNTRVKAILLKEAIKNGCSLLVGTAIFLIILK